MYVYTLNVCVCMRCAEAVEEARQQVSSLGANVLHSEKRKKQALVDDLREVCMGWLWRFVLHEPTDMWLNGHEHTDGLQEARIELQYMEVHDSRDSTNA